MAKMLLFDYEQIKKDIIDGLILYCSCFCSRAMARLDYKRPHFIEQTRKNILYAKIVLDLSRDDYHLDEIIQSAKKYFMENHRRKNFNIIFNDVYLGTVMSRGRKRKFMNSPFFPYYLAIRFRKEIGIFRDEKRAIIRVYVKDLCPLGRYIHAILKEQSHTIIFSRPKTLNRRFNSICIRGKRNAKR